MAIFPNLICEAVIQVDDKTRLDARKSFVTSNEAAITKIEIETHTADGFIDVTSDGYLDYCYQTNGVKVVTVKVTNSNGFSTSSKSIQVNSELEDSLLSNDFDLLIYESGILQYVREGRNTFLDYHRRSKQMILEYLYAVNIVNSDGSKIIASQLTDLSEFKSWSVYNTLFLIYLGLKNTKDDIYHQKSKQYYSELIKIRNKAILKIDFNKDGSTSDFESVEKLTTIFYRR